MKLIKAIYNKIYNIIDGILEKVGYHFVGYKVDILNDGYSIKALQKFTRFNVDDIKAIQLTIKSIREDYESLKTYHNNLSIDYRDNSASHTNLLKLKNELNNRINMIENKKSLLDTPFKDDKLYEVDKETLFINEIEDNNNDKIATLERINKQYERLLTSDNNYILEEIAKILVPYEKEDNLQFYKINDIVDDINDVFNEFNNIYNDVNDNDNNINLTK